MSLCTCLEADFYYFGLSFLHVKVPVSELRKMFDFYFKTFVALSSATGMAGMIREERFG